jgi:hypothetical protein
MKSLHFEEAISRQRSAFASEHRTMNIKELEAKFREIDIIDTQDSANTIKVSVDGNTESSGRLNIGIEDNPPLPPSPRPDAKEDDFLVPSEAEKRSSAPAEEKALSSNFQELLNVNLNDVDIPDEYIQDKIQTAIDNRDQAGALPGVKLSQIGASALYQVEEDYTYVTKSLDATDHTLTAVKGFKYDRSSVPRVFWLVIDKDSLSNVPPLFHDLLYQNGGVLPPNQIVPFRTVTREEADNLFFELMIKSGVKRWRCVMAYQAVRKFSAFAWQTKNV